MFSRLIQGVDQFCGRGQPPKIVLTVVRDLAPRERVHVDDGLVCLSTHKVACDVLMRTRSGNYREDIIRKISNLVQFKGAIKHVSS